MAGAKCDLNEVRDSHSYTIQISEEELQDLYTRLDRARFPDQLQVFLSLLHIYRSKNSDKL